MKKTIHLYGHGGSSNHGNEALIRSFCALMHDYHIICYSWNPDSDKQFGLDQVCEIRPFLRPLPRFSPRNIWGGILRRITGSYVYQIRYWLKDSFTTQPGLYVFIMGDQYCEDRSIRDMYYAAQQVIRSHSSSKVFGLGCSINASNFTEKALLDDLRSYDVLSARDPLTYELLKLNGLTKAQLFPDLAFGLQPKKCDLPSIVNKNETIGMTIGFIPQGHERYFNDLMENIYILLEYLIKNTHYNFALIPHVNNSEENSDFPALRAIFARYAASERFVLVNERQATEQKYCIAQCRFMITTRLHAGIAALSAQVPTLVIGYNIKAAGILQDIFGISDPYVINVEDTSNHARLKNMF